MPAPHLPLHAVSRRTFLSVAASAVTGMVPPKVAALGRAPLGPTGLFGKGAVSGREPVDCVLLDAPRSCAWPESMAGYESALRECGVQFVRSSAASLRPAKTIIVPACLALCPETLRDAIAALKAGSSVILESGAGFTAPEEFAAHQVWLRECWNVRVETPIDLWNDRSEQSGHQRSFRRLAVSGVRLAARAPYVDFYWPLRVKVRDFSRVVPVLAPPGHIVGWCGDRPIASKEAIGRGTLVFLGSPLGPALRAGDTEARCWLRQVIGARCP